MRASSLLRGLNPRQREAVTAPPGPVLVLAGPGSGKTRVLTHRVAYLIQKRGVEPRNIMAVTFTNKAAREMRARIENLLGGRPEGLRIGTFHATCARILRREAECTPLTRDYVIFDTTDQRAVVQAALKGLDLDPKRYRPPAVLARVSQAKNELIGPEAYRSNSYFEEIVGRVYVRYQELLVENNAMDFDDLLMRAVILFRKHPDVLERYRQRYRWVLVDEFQDTNTAQYVLVRLLTEEHRNLFAVGDEDQSIYLFRGADYRNVRRFEEDYPERIRILLEENYRSTQHILDAAGAVIRHNRDRTPKKLFTARKGGPLLTVYEAYNENDEAARVVEIIRHLVENGGEYQPRDVAVMYRTNAQSRALEEAFLVIGMPYRLVGATRFYGRREIKDLIAYLRIAHNPEDTVSLMRIINTPPRRIGTQTVEALTAWATATGRGLSAALMALLDDRHDTTEKPPFSAPAARALRHFASLVAEWQALRQAQPELSPAAWLDKIIDNVGYQAYIDDGTREGQERWENVQELCAVATEYAGLPLSTFLEEVALISDVDTRDDQVNAPSLMTLHSAKGLEFPAVFIVGLEEGLLPHNRSFDDPDAMAEERRLMYVGLTRAKNRLYLSYAFRRSRWGESEVNEPSRFLRDIPVELIEGSARLNLVSARQRAYYRQAVAWNPAPAPAVAPQYKTGQRVRHATFGEGVVVESRVSGGDEEVTVAFGDVGIKRLMASFANLERLEG